MGLAERIARRNQEARLRILVAVIGAAAVVIAAVVTAIAQYSTSSSNAGAGDTVIVPGGQNVAVNTPGTVIQNSPGASVGKKTVFQSQNSMMIQFVDGYTANGKTSLSLGMRNLSDRFIGNAEIFAFSLASAHPVFIEKSEPFGLGPGQIQPIETLTFSGQAPEKLQLCLSFPAAEAGSFLAVLMNMRLKKIGEYHFKYEMTSDYDVYFSERQGDCVRRFHKKTVPAAEYSGASS